MKTNAPVLYPNEEVAEKVTTYAENHTDRLPQELVLYHNWVCSQDKSNLTISQYQARALMWLVKATCARRVLEIGVFRGFSMAAFSNAVGDFASAEIVGLEANEEYALSAEKGLSRFGVNKYKIYLGDAHKTMQVLESPAPFDLIFIDAEKSGYVEYLRTILGRSHTSTPRRLLRPGGLIVADNVLRGSLVADPSESNPAHARQKDAKSSGYWSNVDVHMLDVYNQVVVQNPRLDAFLLPLFDGLSLARLVD